MLVSLLVASNVSGFHYRRIGSWIMLSNLSGTEAWNCWRITINDPMRFRDVSGSQLSRGFFVIRTPYIACTRCTRWYRSVHTMYFMGVRMRHYPDKIGLQSNPSPTLARAVGQITNLVRVISTNHRACSMTQTAVRGSQ